MMVPIKEIYGNTTLYPIPGRKCLYCRSIKIKAVGFSAGNKGYIGTGEDSVGNNLNDMWEFNGSWTQVSNFAGGIRSKATAFAINDKGYVGTGFDGSNFYNDLWEYNTTNNTWLQLASLPEQFV
ncbi:MAG: hypothetical protein IPG85_17325 [Bacteroidetes bacterium]|nr:hypothetical protein [Bacteroidota bacterium]